MTVKVNKDFYNILDRKEKQGLLAAAEFVKIKQKEALNKTGTSKPGEAPGKDSGDLYDSIQVDKSDIARKSVKIGSDEIYAAALEGGTIYIAPRPWIRKSFRENKKGVIDAFVKGVNR